MYAKKLNKVYQVETMPEMQRYLAMGFDIYNDNGEIVKHNPSKTIAYTEYQRLLEENNDLRAELAGLHLRLAGMVQTEPPEADTEPKVLTPAAPEDPESIPDDDAPKTLTPAADDSIPKMGGKGAKVKATSAKEDGGEAK